MSGQGNKVLRTWHFIWFRLALKNTNVEETAKKCVVCPVLNTNASPFFQLLTITFTKHPCFQNDHSGKPVFALLCLALGRRLLCFPSRGLELLFIISHLNVFHQPSRMYDISSTDTVLFCFFSSSVKEKQKRILSWAAAASCVM